MDLDTTSGQNDAVTFEDEPGQLEFLDFLRQVFDPEYYLFRYPDLDQGIKRDLTAEGRHIVRMFAGPDSPGIDLIEHFIAHGLQEGRTPSILFDVSYLHLCLSKYGHGKVAPGEVLRVFAALPDCERFVPNAWFSAWAFRKLYGRSEPALLDMTDYETFAFYAERCSYAALSPNGVFNEESYRLRYPDVAAAVGRAQFRSALMHFGSHGQGDGRLNLPGTTERCYPGTGQSEFEFLFSGRSANGSVVWWLDEGFYLGIYPDVHDLVRRSIVKSALEHYLVVGAREGRLPSPWMLRLLPDRDDPELWMYFAGLGSPECQLGRGSITLKDASAIVQLLSAQPWAGAPSQICEALWPFVAQPAIDGTVAVPEYLAANVDVAIALKAAPADEVARHWREHGAQEHRPSPGSNMFGKRAVTFENVLHWKSGVNYFGPIASANGLGASARGFATALRAAGIPIAEYDTSWLIDGERPAPIFSSDELPYSINLLCINADQVALFALRYGVEVFQGRANAGVWVWELPAPPPEWRSILSGFDLVILPSQFCRDSFALSTDLPLAVIPYVVDEDALVAASRKPTRHPALAQVAAAKSAGKRIVLFIMDASSYTARKGVDVFRTLAARVEAARPGEFLFVLKSHSTDRFEATNDGSGQGIFEIKALIAFDELCALKTMADLYISPHRSEGFGFNIIESILLGVPVLCSAFGGILDLLAMNDPPLIPVSLREIGKDLGPYRAEAIWAEPNLDLLEASFLKFFATNRTSRKFFALRNRLKAELSPANVGAKLVQALTQYCALGAESGPNPLEAFRHLANKPIRETYVLRSVAKDARRSLDTPGVERITEIMAGAFRPTFSIITPTYNTEPHWLEEIFDDLLQQTDPSWEWCIADDGSDRADTLAKLRSLRRRDSRIKLQIGRRNGGISVATNAAVAIAQGRYLVLVDHDDRVEPNLLQTYGARLDQATFEGVLYCDEDKLSMTGELCDSYLKPDWSPEHLLSCMYVLHCLCIRKSTFLALGGYRSEFDGAQDHDFVLRVVAAGYQVRHVDQVLYHWRMAPASMAGSTSAKNPAIENGRKAVAAYVRAVGMKATVTHGLAPGTYRVRPALPATSVDINILTGCTALGRASADGAGPATFVEQFVRSILAHAPSIAFRIRIIVDAPKLAFALPLADLDARISVVPFARNSASFNFSEMANFAVTSSETDRVVLLNDDMLAIDDTWLTALLEPLEFSGIGVVGGRLLYGDDRLQHCGIILGVHGAAAHVFEGENLTFVGYNSFNRVMRNYSAVTGAMMAFRRSAFSRVGGFDTIFPVDFNDVDFCLKLTQSGLRNVYTPFATLRHFESRSARRFATDALDRARFLRRWYGIIARDPYYNLGLPRDNAMCDVVPQWVGRKLPPVEQAGLD
ncbi:glycosyltransferase [Acidisoma cellulosilytica]|uniref:Glycosyltransferase n=1 Tax=Acidisoma cellulosilyticum TaxID=2802395 RepID=A0A964E6C9_9PROT|nr:glycosyltransferase [Acidisoma cellulosilyticum]MCB8883367.1 glycosyltransferase [Acidisoma cellulosilyticum]